MALKTFNVQGGLSIGSVGDIFDANANLNLTANIPNVALGNVGNLHISGGNANAAVLGTVSLNGDGNVTAIAITSRGDGYTIAPTISITGGNSGAANATVSLYANGAINTITINTAGTGYSAGTVAAAITSPMTKYLKTDGAGNLAWNEVAATGGGGSGTPGGSNTQVQYNDAGSFGGSNAFTFNESTATTTFGNVLSIAGDTGGNIDVVTTATITSTANTNFNITGAANANLTIKAANNRASLTSNGTSGSTVVGYADADTNLTAANITANANTITMIAAANASNTTGSSSTVTVASDGGISATSANGNVTLAVTTSGGANDAKANAKISNTAITLAAAANGANTTGNSASLGVTTTGITGAASNGNVTFSTSVQGNADAAQGNIIINNSAVTLQTAANAANATGNSSTITLNTTGGIAATSANGNVNLSVTTAGGTNAAKANARISNTTITLAAASNGANTVTNSTIVTLDDTDGANIKVNTGNIGMYYTDGANAAGNLVISNNSIAFSTQSNTADADLAKAVFNLKAAAESNLITSGNIVIKSDANLANTFSSAQILLNGNANSVTIGANANSTLVVTDSNATFTSNVVITGNLTVQGNAIYANTETLVVEDPIIQLGTGANGVPLTSNDGKDRGVELHTYGSGGPLTTDGSTPQGNTFIAFTGSNAAFAVGQLVGFAANPAAIPAGANIVAVNASNIEISVATTAIIPTGATVAAGDDTLRFMGWSNNNSEFRFYSDATNTNEVIGGTLGNVRAANFIGTLANGNSNIAITSNANIVLTANGNAVTTFTSNGDGNLQLIGSNTVGYVSATGNVIAIGNVKSNNNVVLEGVLQFSANYESNAAANNFSNIGAAKLTTTSTSSVALATIPAADGRAVEFIVKGVDTAGSKYYAATLLALAGNTANADLDYSAYAVQQIGTTVGAVTIALADSNANITLSITPATTNSTAWTTQYRVI